MDQFNFIIKHTGEISGLFLERKINDFMSATHYIKMLPYGRNQTKHDLTTVFTDQCGTCSTKHAILKLLSMENGIDEVKLKLGMFKMNGENTPAIRHRLEEQELAYIPEAHNYLVINNSILDCTRQNSKKEDFFKDLLNEIEIMPSQITDFKVEYHQLFLKTWLKENKQIKFSLAELWNIREACIQDLAS